MDVMGCVAGVVAAVDSVVGVVGAGGSAECGECGGVWSGVECDVGQWCHCCGVVGYPSSSSREAASS